MSHAPEDVFALAGADALERMVAAFYRRVPADPLLGPMYPEHDLVGAEERLRDFLRYRLGGPDDYLRTRGHPRLRARHGPFAITAAAAARWVELMDAAIDEAAVPAPAAEVLRPFFRQVAEFLINR